MEFDQNLPAIYLNDPKELPFGKLSPNYIEKITVKNEESSNIISYSYAGLLKNGDVKRNVLSSKPKEAIKSSLHFFRTDKDEIFL
jgi:hypothetical protein